MLAPRAGKVKVRPLLQPWGYLYGLILPSHTETIHSYLLLISVSSVAARLGRALLPRPILRPPVHPGPPTPWPAGERGPPPARVPCPAAKNLAHFHHSSTRCTPESGKPAGRTFHGVFPSPVVAPPQGAASRRSRRRAHLLTWNLAEFLTSTAAHAVCSNTIPRCSVLSSPPSPPSSLHAK